ncbi:MAG: dehydrogenase, partial [Gemmatimonas sp.]
MTHRVGAGTCVRWLTGAWLLLSACDRGPAPVAPVYTPKQALATFKLPPGYSIELVAAEPLVHDPVAIDFDADGRMYVVEMSGYMPSVSGEGEHVPNGKIVVLEDTDDDGRIDRRTVFLDSLVLPRTVAVLEQGILVGAPPFLWLLRDTTGDFRADTRVIVRDDYGATDANPEHNANGARWGLDNWLHAANDTRELRLRADGTFESRHTPSLGQWGISSDEYGRLYRNSNEDPLRTDLIPAHYATRDGVTAPLRGLYSALTKNVAVFPSRRTPAVNRGYREKTLRADSTLAHYTSAGSPTAYVGDRYPAAMRRSVFVTESAGNLVGQFIVENANGAPSSARR